MMTRVCCYKCGKSEEVDKGFYDYLVVRNLNFYCEKCSPINEPLNGLDPSMYKRWTGDKNFPYVEIDEPCFTKTVTGGRIWKTRWDLLPIDLIEDVANILTQGADKHGDFDWQNMSPDDHYNALMRHLANFKNGVIVDGDSGQLSAGHVATRALMLLWFSKQGVKKIG